MDKLPEHIITVLTRFAVGETLTAGEQEELDEWRGLSRLNSDLTDSLKNAGFIKEGLAKRLLAQTLQESDWNKVADHIRKNGNAQPIASMPAHRIRFLKTTWFRYAAAMILILGVAAYFLVNEKTEQTLISQTKRLQMDIAPGTNRAVLTVDNKKIDLASDKTGITIGGKIAYTDGERLSDAGEMLMLTTPKGGQYQVTLPDGSKVWLNAASSIKFPAVFKGEKRNVEMSGEVYMEIAQNSKQPFVVSVGGAEIQVLGTSFNVNAYEDEGAIKTTLVDGSVKINQNVVLKPGQQCSITDGQSTVVSNANLDQAVAWKNGIFNFRGLDLKSVMRQLERWYDIKVQYKGSIPSDLTLEGKMYRSVNLSNIIRVLKETGVNVELEGKILTVL